MKVIANVAVILVALLVVSSGQNLSEEEQKKIQKHRVDCVAETKVDPELIDRADKGDFVDDDKLKCFTKCFYQKAGFVTETGELEIETIKAKIPATVDKEKALKVIENCKQKGKDACETVYLIHKCYFEFNHPPKSDETKKTTEEGKENKNDNQKENKEDSHTESRKESEKA